MRSQTNMNATTSMPRNVTMVITSMPEAKTTLIRISTLLNDSAAMTPGHNSPNWALRASGGGTHCDSVRDGAATRRGFSDADIPPWSWPDAPVESRRTRCPTPCRARGDAFTAGFPIATMVCLAACSLPRTAAAGL